LSPETDEFLGLLALLRREARVVARSGRMDAMSSPQKPTMTLITLKSAPPIVRGLVRDLRPRWALEETGLPYDVVQLGPDEQRAAPHLARQPFGQIPAFVDGDVALFESGAIVQYVAERSPVLLPSEPAARARVMSWMFAAVTDLEPPASNLQEVDWFHAKEPWAKPRRPAVIDFLRLRFGALADWLRDREHVAGAFSAADILVIAVLRMVRHTDLVSEFPVLVAYQARCEARPAFKRALEDHMAAFAKHDRGD
jgi:glutathione S-transferase